MPAFTLHDLRCFDAVVREGGFQAAAAALHRSHPAVFAGVARLEAQAGIALFDRSGYRVALTEAGRAFHARAGRVLGELDQLEAFAEHLATGEEPMLRIVVGDLCPPEILARLSAFFRLHAPATRLHLSYETVGGPLERLLDGEADLMLHRAEPAEARIELLPLGEVALVPVAAPGFLPQPPAELGPETLARYTQCVIRDTARRSASESHFLVEGAHQCSAPDHLIKRELILQGLAWGHLPNFLIDADLREGRLRSLAGPRLPGRVEAVAAARRSDRPHGPVAERLWTWLRDEDLPGEGAAASLPA